MMRRVVIPITCLALFATSAAAADWPMWRHDPQRSAATDEELADALHPQWVRKYPPSQPTWPGAPRQLFDPVHQPVVAGKTMFLCLKPSDKLVALDVETGAEKWTFFAEGPMRFAPACHGGRVFVGSDDGYLYCLDAENGKVLWKFRGGPVELRFIGHDRLISTWPISSGPVIADGKVYFSAGIWPFMEVFYHALDAGTGKVLWTNDETSTLFRAMPKYHPNATALSGPTPQGYAVVLGDRLFIPCGRGMPVCFDRLTGRFLYYESTAGGKVYVKPNAVTSAAGNYFFNGNGVFDASNGKWVSTLPGPVEAADVRAVYSKNAAWDYRKTRTETYKDWQGVEAERVVVPKLYDLPRGRVFLKAGRRLYAHNPGKLLSIGLAVQGENPEVAWTVPFEETVGDMLAADGKLFVVTTEGSIHCFGPTKVEPKMLESKPQPLAVLDDDWTLKASTILAQSGAEPGYGVLFGIDSGRLVEELVRKSPLHVIGVDADRAKIDTLRRKFDTAGLYGTRVSLHVADPEHFVLPPYFARLIVVRDRPTAGPDLVKRLFRSLRPYGGVACFAISVERHAALAKDIADAALPGAELKREGDLSVLARVGPLDGAGSWTHDNANAARQTRSTDRVAKAPLGVLWFGGEAGGDIFRQGNYPQGPSPLVIGGRMILQGIHSLYAVDVYSGRILWKTPLPPPEDRTNPTRDVGYISGEARSYCYTQALAGDAFYIGHGRTCRVFDPATGRQTASWQMPGANADARWGNLLLIDDVLVGASCTPVDPQKLPADDRKLSIRETVRLLEWLEALKRIRALPLMKTSTDEYDAYLKKLVEPGTLADKFPRYKASPIAASMENADRVVAVDRHTGKPLWTYECTYGMQHNRALVAGGGKVFVVDAWPKAVADVLKHRGKLPEDYAPKLVALDLKTGSVLWSRTDTVWGDCGLSYADKLDIISQAGGSRVARKAEDGSILWQKRMHCEDYGWYHPSIITDDTVISYLGDAYNLATGQRKTIAHPLTGEPVPLTVFTRSHGCNHAVASENLVTLRVGNAAYVDLLNFSGTHSLGGFRSGCQNSLIVADGVLSAPRYSRCACNYPIFTSLGLIHMPELDQWSFFGSTMRVRGRVKRVGLNLGAPGDRRAKDGTLWLDVPSEGGPSPDIPVRITPEKIEWFCHRSAAFTGDGPGWVAASGGKGIREIVVTLAPDAKDQKTYTVRLHFAEPDDVKPGERRFDVNIQGKNVFSNVDVVREANGRNRCLVREVRNVKVTDTLSVKLTPAPGAPLPVPILSGVEAVMTDE